MWIFVLLSVFIFVNQSVAQSCVCASENTDVYRFPNHTSVRLGVLSAPNCVLYKNKQTSTEVDNFGFLHALVEFHGQDAWVDTRTVYVRPCHEPFSCVCAVKSTVIRAHQSENALAVKQFIHKTCRSIAEQGQGHSGQWTKVKLTDRKHGWVKTQDVAFHDRCRRLHLSPFENNVELPGCPPIITRRDWGARASRAVNLLTQTPFYLLVHHGATIGCSYREECIREVRAYQDFHMDAHGWDDIGYSFLIGGDGNVYEGRGWNRIGAHTRHYNAVGLGTCMIGNYMKAPPTLAQLYQLRRLFACSVANNKVTSDYTLLGHRDTWNGTLCPGDKLHDIIETWPHFDLQHRRVAFG
ncbi:uncharacterized protein LOC121385444 isoform X2 [Gigantopelta aegis]|nr:uncharacterized protein LOC121385444 isoform X2 [Gigantopelta aegis]XP_041372061.1 uncharacterized protein LOC121385444 isoform X2 [Gigantopelta aegis]XP_041372062.1 uncharacterized protein LOC121385444 isoform X2 [Gigantopelta aegis]